MDPTSTDLSPEMAASLLEELQAQLALYKETAQPKIYATLAVCALIAYAGLGMRLYARHLTKQPLGADDLFVILALVFTTISIALLAYVTHLGVGRHEIVLIAERVGEAGSLTKGLFALIVVYALVIFFVKASALMLYRRIFPNRAFRTICLVLLLFIALCTLACVLTLTISCLPLNLTTEQEPVPSFKCSDDFVSAFLLVSLSTNVVLDAVILCLPLPLIWRLATNLRRKLQLTLVFTLGSFIFIISILRVIAATKLVPLDDNWYSTDVEIWSTAESAVGILTVSLPVIQPVLRKAIYRRDGSYRFARIRPDTGVTPVNTSAPAAAALLTFGRGAFKGPRDRRPRGMDETSVATLDEGIACDGSNKQNLQSPEFQQACREHVELEKLVALQRSSPASSSESSSSMHRV